MRYLLKISLSIIGCLMLFACQYLETTPRKHLLSSDKLLKSIAEKDTSILLFYTDWCSGKSIIDEVYSSYLRKISTEKENYQIILIASDDDISDSLIDHRTNQHFLSARISAGSNAFMNRIKIRKFINASFPYHNIGELNEFGFTIPLALWITKNGQILNEKDVSNTTSFSDKLMGTRTIEILRR